MYLPKSQYKLTKVKDIPNVKDVVDRLGNFINSNKQVVLTSFGTMFDKAGIDFDKGDFSKALELFSTGTPEEAESRDQPGYESDKDTPELNSSGKTVSLKLPPTTADKKKGIMQRCFYYNKCTGKALEISKVQLNNLSMDKDLCTELAIAEWYIKGSAKDRTVNGYFLEGLETVNNRTIQQIKKTIPVIEGLIKSPLEYVEDTFIPSSIEYKSQIKDIIIPSPGKEL